MYKSIFVLQGGRNVFPSGVFSTFEKAKSYISKHSLTCTLLEMPLNIKPSEALISPDATIRNRREPESRIINQFHFEDGLTINK